MLKASELQFNQKALGESMEEVRQQVPNYTMMIQKCDCCVVNEQLRTVSEVVFGFWSRKRSPTAHECHRQSCPCWTLKARLF